MVPPSETAVNPQIPAIDAIILAGGRSSRMGFPKALLSVDGVPQIDRLARAFQQSGIRQVIAVLGTLHGVRICREADLAGVRVVINPDQDAALVESFQFGLRAVDPGCAAVFHVPVDAVGVDEAVINAILHAFVRRRAGIIVPVFAGKRGHPVLWRNDIVTELLTLKSGETPRDLQSQHKSEIELLTVPHAGILSNVNRLDQCEGMDCRAPAATPQVEDRTMKQQSQTVTPDLVLRNVTAINIHNGAIHVLPDAELVISDGKISKLQPMEAEPPSGEVIDMGGRVALPGFINCHMHFYSTFARGIRLASEPPVNFPQILERLWWWLDKGLTAEDIALSALPVLIESIKAGTTTVFDHHASPNAIDGSLSAIAKVVELAGVRADLCYEVSDRDGAETAAAGLAENARFLDECAERDTDWLRGHFGLHAAFTLSNATLRLASQLGNARGAGFHIHVAEDLHDQTESKAYHAKRVAYRLNEHGILNPKTILAHCVHIDQGEAAVIAQSGAFVAHNPESNMGNAVGIANLDMLLGAGVRIGLGTDGCTSRMPNSIRVTGNLQHVRTGDPRTFGAGQILDLAFYQPARLATDAFGLPLGTLEPGAGADVVVVDYRPPTPLLPETFIGHLLFGITDSPVHATIARGKLLYHQGKLLHIDEEAVAAKARELAQAMWRRLGV